MRKPLQVKAVFDALVRNAQDSELPHPAVAVSCYQRENGEWVAGSNMEDGHSSMIFRDNKWFSRNPGTGEDTEMKGGFDEAMANAGIFFTG